MGVFLIVPTGENVSGGIWEIGKGYVSIVPPEKIFFSSLYDVVQVTERVEFIVYQTEEGSVDAWVYWWPEVNPPTLAFILPPGIYAGIKDKGKFIISNLRYQFPSAPYVAFPIKTKARGYTTKQRQPSKALALEIGGDAVALDVERLFGPDAIYETYEAGGKRVMRVEWTGVHGRRTTVLEYDTVKQRWVVVNPGFCITSPDPSLLPVEAITKLEAMHSHGRTVSGYTITVG